MRRVLCLILFFFASRAVMHAQYVEGYGALSFTHLSSVELLPYHSTEYSTYNATGGTFGATINFVNSRLLNVGFDVRDSAASGANIWLAGFEVKAKPPALPLKPYLRLSVGEAHVHIPQTVDSTIPNPVYDEFYLYNAALGVDYRLTRFIDARVIEIGDGKTLGAGSANPGSFLTVNTGILVHF